MSYLRRSLGLAFFLCLTTASGAVAQAVTGAITGRVIDADGLAMPGVTVTITSPSMIGDRSAVSDEGGVYRFTLLSPGSYRVAFVLTGFAPLNVDGVTVGTGTTMTINGTLKLGTFAEAITVTSAAPVIDLEAATVGVNWSKENMELLPSGRSLPSLVGMIPGLYATQYDVGASTMGGTAAPPSRTYGKVGGNVVMYEGVIFDQFFGDFSSYDEVQITSAAKGAEAPNAGATFNFVVKSGGNQFHGAGLFAWQDAMLQSNNVSPDLIARGLSATGNKYTHYTDVKAELGGPILRDKLWFFASYTDSYSGQFIPGFISEKDGAPAEFYTRLFGPTNRFTYQPTKKMKFDYVQQVARKWQPYREADQFKPLEATTSQSYWGHVSSLKWMFFPNSLMTADLAVNRAGTWTTYGAWTQNVRRQDLTTTRSVGAAPTDYRDPSRWQYNGSTSLFFEERGRRHEVKAGFIGFREMNQTEFTGYPNQQLYRYRSVAGDADVFQRPDSVQVFDYPLSTRVGVNYNSVYLNDRVNLTSRLTVNLGVRFDRYTSWLPEQGNPGTGPFATRNIIPEQRNFPKYNDWNPRASVAYDVFGNGRMALKASYGRYSGASSGYTPHPGPSAGNVNTAAVVTRTYNNWDGTVPYVPVAANLASTSGGGRQRLDTNLTSLITDEVTIGAEFGHRDYTMRFNVVRKNDIGGSNVLDLAMPYSSYTDVRSAVDPGRDNIIGTADDGVMSAWSVPRTFVGFNQVDRLITNLKDGEGGTNYTAYEATFSKQRSNGWSLLASGVIDAADARNPTPQNPNQERYNWEFKRWNYGIKVNGTYELPFGLSLASTYNAQSGEYFSRSAQMRNALNTLVTVVVEGNAGRYDWVRLWDNRLTRTFGVGKGRSLQVSLDVYNTLNAATVLSQVNINGPLYLRPSAGSASAATAQAILPPRILRLGARFSF